MIPTPPPAIISPVFADRAARISDRITQDWQTQILTPAQTPLLRAELDAAKRAKSAAMLDVIERQLAQVDRSLSRSSDGTVIVVHTGDDVTIAMNDNEHWNLAVSDPADLVLHRGVMFVRGVQGVFGAAKPGTVTATLTSGTNKQVSFTIVILPKPAV